MTLDDSSITLNESTYLRVTTTGAPNGVFYGTVQVGDMGFRLKAKGSNTYVAELVGGFIHRQTNAPLFVVIADDDGAVVYGTPLSLSVTDAGGYFARPVALIKTWLEQNWDTATGVRPKVTKVRDEAHLEDLDLAHGVIALQEFVVDTQERGRGDYKDNEYQVEIIVMREGTNQAEDIWEDNVAEVKRILGLFWRYIAQTDFDFITADDDGHDLSDESAGRYEWRWRLRIRAPLRGRSLTSAVMDDEETQKGEVMEIVNTLPAVGDARVGIFYLLLGGTGARNKIYYKDKDDSDTYRMLETARPFHTMIITPVDSSTNVAVGDGTLFGTIPFWLDGYELFDVTASVDTPGATSGTTDVQVRRSRAGADADMLSTKVTLGVGEYTASDGVVDTANDDVQTGDGIFVDVDAINGTAPKGLSVALTFYHNG